MEALSHPNGFGKSKGQKPLPAAREARAAPPVKAWRDRLLPSSTAALSRPKESSFPGATQIPQATSTDLTWFYPRAAQLLRATPIPRYLGLTTRCMSMMVGVLPLLLCLLEGAEGSQVLIPPRRGAGSLPAGHLPAIPTPPVVTKFILASLFEAKFLVQERDGDTLLPPVRLQNTHFDKQLLVQGLRPDLQTSPILHCLFRRPSNHPDQHWARRSTRYLWRVPSP